MYLYCGYSVKQPKLNQKDRTYFTEHVRSKGKGNVYGVYDSVQGDWEGIG